jgi:hypothetical protein
MRLNDIALETVSKKINNRNDSFDRFGAKAEARPRFSASEE